MSLEIMSKQLGLGLIDATSVCETPLRRPDIELHGQDGEAVVFLRPIGRCTSIQRGNTGCVGRL